MINQSTMMHRPGGTSSTRCKSKATPSSPLFQGADNYVPNRRTLGLELVASEEILAKHSDYWSSAHSKNGDDEHCVSATETNSTRQSNGERGSAAQRRRLKHTRTLTSAVATKMTSTLRCFLAPSSQTSPSSSSSSKTDSSLVVTDGGSRAKDRGRVPSSSSSVPEDEPASTPKKATTTAKAIRRLEANARDTPSIFANARKNGRKSTGTQKSPKKEEAAFDVSFDEIAESNKSAHDGAIIPPPSNVDEFDAFEECVVGVSNQGTSILDFTLLGKDGNNATEERNIEVEDDDDDNSFVLQGQETFDSAFNFSAVSASSSKSFTQTTVVEDHSLGKDIIDQDQIEFTDDDTYYGEEKTCDKDSSIAINGAAAGDAAPVAFDIHCSGDDLVEVDTATMAKPSDYSPSLLTKNGPYPRTRVSSSYDSHEIEISSRQVDGQQKKQLEKNSSSNRPVSVRGGAALATFDVREFFCSPKVSSSEIHRLLRADSFMDYSVNSTPVLESQISLSMKREFSNESPTGVDQLNSSEYHTEIDSDNNNIVHEGKDDADDDDDATWNSLDTQKTVNTCNTSKISRRRSSSITSQKIRRVHFENDGDQEDFRDYATVHELKRGRSGYSIECGEEDPQEIKQKIERTENVKSLTSDDLTATVTPANTNFVGGVTQLFGKCFVNDTVGSSTRGKVREPPTTLVEDHNEATVDEPLKCIHPPKIYRNLRPIDLFHAKDHTDCGGLRDVYQMESIDEDGKSRFEDLKNQVDDDSLETSTVDSTVFTLNSTESMESSTIQTDRESGCNPMSSWVDNGFFGVIGKMDSALNGCTKDDNDDCSDAPFDEEDHDNMDEDSDDEEELSDQGNWEIRNGRCSSYYRSRSRHLRQQTREGSNVCDANRDASRTDVEYRVRFLPPAEPDGSTGSVGCGSNVILPSMSDSLILGNQRQLRDSSPQEFITKTLSVDGALEAQRADIAADQSKFGLYRSYTQKKRRFRILRRD